MLQLQLVDEGIQGRHRSEAVSGTRWLGAEDEWEALEDGGL